MNAFGGFITASRSDGARLTYPIAMAADGEGEAEIKARAAAFETWSVSANYSNHAWGVVQLPNATVHIVEERGE